MQGFVKLLLGLGLACALAMPAFAHAFLDHATPGVGETVQSASELELHFTQDVVIAFSGVSLKTAAGQPVSVGKPSVGPANTLHIRLAHALKPGTYVVSWHVVSVDTHHTAGSYKFTVAP